MGDPTSARWDALANLLDVDPEDVEAEVRNIRAKLADATYRLVTVLTWHNPVESEYRDADGNVTRTVTECAHCSILSGDGVDWPCATARALGALDSGIAEAEKHGAVKALRMVDDRLLTERDARRSIRAGRDWPRGVEDAARTVRSLADRIESGEVTLP